MSRAAATRPGRRVRHRERRGFAEPAQRVGLVVTVAQVPQDVDGHRVAVDGPGVVGQSMWNSRGCPTWRPGHAVAGLLVHAQRLLAEVHGPVVVTELRVAPTHGAECLGLTRTVSGRPEVRQRLGGMAQRLGVVAALVPQAADVELHLAQAGRVGQAAEPVQGLASSRSASSCRPSQV